MKARRNYQASSLSAMPVDKAIVAIGQMLDTLFTVVNRLAIQPVADGKQAGNLDGVFLVAVFTGTSNTTFHHALGRAPVMMFEVHPVLPAGETVGQFGEVQMIAATATTVTLKSQAAKTARLILM